MLRALAITGVFLAAGVAFAGDAARLPWNPFAKNVEGDWVAFGDENKFVIVRTGRVAEGKAELVSTPRRKQRVGITLSTEASEPPTFAQIVALLEPNEE